MSFTLCVGSVHTLHLIATLPSIPPSAEQLLLLPLPLVALMLLPLLLLPLLLLPLLLLLLLMLMLMLPPPPLLLLLLLLSQDHTAASLTHTHMPRHTPMHVQEPLATPMPLLCPLLLQQSQQPATHKLLGSMALKHAACMHGAAHACTQNPSPHHQLQQPPFSRPLYSGGRPHAPMRAHANAPRQCGPQSS